MDSIGRISLKQNYLTQVKRFQQLSRKPSTKISGLISLTIFLVAFFGIFAILPTFKTIAGLKREIEDIEVVNRKLGNKVRALSKAEELYTRVSKDIARVNQVLPEKAEFERLAWQIEWLALNKGVEIVNGNYNEFDLITVPTQTGELQKLEIELSINGSYLKIAEFVGSVTNIDRLMEIKAISINSKKLRQGEAVSANIRLTAYYLPSYVK